MIVGALLCGFVTGGMFVIGLMTWLSNNEGESREH